MHLVVIGQSGQLANALAATVLPAPDWRLTNIGRPAFDITDKAKVRAAIYDLAPDVVINAAAYTAVDRAETEPDAAFAVNRDGAASVAAAAALNAVPIIHISTDYVFAGDNSRPYLETDPVAPLNIYGRSKLAGEEAVATANPRHIILRTSWVHSPWGQNFVKTMLRLGAEKAELRIVGDQVGTPTFAPDLASAIIDIAREVIDLAAGSDKWGTCHLTNAGSTTWFEFAAEIFRIAATCGARVPELARIGTADYPTPAPRPAYSVLDCSKIADAFGVRLRPWNEGANECVRQLLAAAKIAPR